MRTAKEKQMILNTKKAIASLISDYSSTEFKIIKAEDFLKKSGLSVYYQLFKALDEMGAIERKFTGKGETRVSRLKLNDKILEVSPTKVYHLMVRYRRRIYLNKTETKTKTWEVRKRKNKIKSRTWLGTVQDFFKKFKEKKEEKIQQKIQQKTKFQKQEEIREKCIAQYDEKARQERERFLRSVEEIYEK